VAVSQEVLASEEHLGSGVGQELFESPEPLPGVFVEESDAGVECGSSPAFQRPISCLIEDFAGGDHVFESHSRGHQALVSISENDVGDFDGPWHRLDFQNTPGFVGPGPILGLHFRGLRWSWVQEPGAALWPDRRGRPLALRSALLGSSPQRHNLADRHHSEVSPCPRPIDSSDVNDAGCLLDAFIVCSRKYFLRNP
jgi:hypothetical protein